MKRNPFRPSLAMKLSVMLLCVVLLPVFVVQTALYDSYSTVADERVRIYMSQSFETLYERVEGCFDNMKAQVGYLLYAQDLYLPLAHDYHGMDRTLVDEAMRLSALFSDANRIYTQVDTEYTLLVDDGRLFGTWGTLRASTEQTWLSQALAGPTVRGSVWTVLDDGLVGGTNVSALAPSLAILRGIAGSSHGAVLIASLRLSSFEALLGIGDEAAGESSILLLDGAGAIRYAGGLPVESGMLELVEALGGETDDAEIAQLEASGYYFLARKLRANGWTLVRVLDETASYRASVRQRGYALWMLIVFCCLLVGLTFAVVYGSMARLRKLDAAMRAFSSGEEARTLAVHGRDEIAAMTARYNGMIERIEALVLKTQADEKEKSRLFYEALLAQITPHFLYNTLNSIKWVAMLSRAPNVADLIASLGALLEASTAKHGEILTLGEELTNLGHYMNLQYARFGEKVRMRVDVPDEVRGLGIPKFILQPFVENALIHGFDRQQRRGEIAVSVECTGDAVMLFVADNGRGISAARLTALRDEAKYGVKRGDKRSIGILNAHRRLQYLYGRGYGVMLCTGEGHGTTACLRLPARDEARGEGAHV